MENKVKSALDNQGIAVKAVMLTVLVPVVVLGGTTEPVGFKEQCQKQLAVGHVPQFQQGV